MISLSDSWHQQTIKKVVWSISFYLLVYNNKVLQHQVSDISPKSKNVQSHFLRYHSIAFYFFITNEPSIKRPDVIFESRRFVKKSSVQKTTKFQKNSKFSYLCASLRMSISHRYVKLQCASFKTNSSVAGQCGRVLPLVTSVFFPQMTNKMTKNSSWGVFHGISEVLCQ